MREIKFRAWDDIEEKMFPVKSIYFSSEGVFTAVKAKPDYVIDPRYCTLMQYTGINDKNGKEIYEGDIVNIYQRLSEYVSGHGKAVVEFIYGHWNICDNSIFIFENGTEVIGNIYENPELIHKEEIK